MSTSQRPPELWVCHLGTVEYRRAVAAQEHVRALRQADELPDVLLTLDHPPVYTLGRRSQEGDLPLSAEACRARGIDVVATDRGGQLTYHGPGQLVGYPIMRVEDVLAFVRMMERAMISALADEHVDAQVRDGLTGVWVGQAKIGSIGLHVSRGVTTHGFAVNVENDLAPFATVVPCGLPGVTMTSVSRERGDRVGLACFRRHAAHRFAEVHGRRQRLVSPARLGLADLPLAPSPRRAEVTAAAPLALPT